MDKVQVYNLTKILIRTGTKDKKTVTTYCDAYFKANMITEEQYLELLELNEKR